MKRIIFLLLAAATFGLWTPQAVPAEEGRRIGFLFNLGFMTGKGLSLQWGTLGAELALPLGAGWSLNPEVSLWGYHFGFETYYIVPGVLVNFRVGRFAVGVGPVRRFWFSEFSNNGPSEKIVPKFQVGYRSRGSRIALVVIPLSNQSYVSVGVSLGFGF
jgi:hypothetical protein